MIKKAMIFAAGYGTRLRPLTQLLPKPLVPVLNRPLLHHTLEKLAQIGISEVVINLHYLSERIIEYTQIKNKWNLTINYSIEKEQILGTAGGLAAAEQFFKNEENFIIVNGDILFQFDLKQMVEKHLRSNAAATLAVTEFNSKKGKPLGIDKKGRILSVPEMTPTSELTPVGFTGIHITSKEIFQFLKELPPPPSCIIRTAYRKMLEAGLTLNSHYIPPDTWSDIGTPKDYLLANLQLLRETSPQNPPPKLLGKNTQIESSVSIGPETIVGDNAKLNGELFLQKAIVWPGVEFRGRGSYENIIVYSSHNPNMQL